MSNFKIAKILTSTDINTVDDNNMILQSDGGPHDGFRMYVKSNNIIRRLLPPYEEFNKYWEFENIEDSELEEPVIHVVDSEPSTKYININSTVRAEDLIIYLPQVSITNILYLYPIRIAIQNSAGFYIKLLDGDSNVIIDDKTELLVTGKNTTFEIFLSPDGVWRILGTWN